MAVRVNNESVKGQGLTCKKSFNEAVIELKVFPLLRRHLLPPDISSGGNACLLLQASQFPIQTFILASRHIWTHYQEPAPEVPLRGASFIEVTEGAVLLGTAAESGSLRRHGAPHVI